jgi:DNA-binding NtrC family response regulator
MDVWGAGRRVLVAEDEFVIALEVEEALRRAGYEVVGPVATADEVERLAREGRLDAAVLDVVLRGGTVFAAADLLAGLGVPFVLLTGSLEKTVPERFRGRPFLDKPFAAEGLPAALEGAVREERVRRRAHTIWEREGRPVGRDARHWAEAEAQLRAEEEGERWPDGVGGCCG